MKKGILLCIAIFSFTVGYSQTPIYGLVADTYVTAGKAKDVPHGAEDNVMVKTASTGESNDGTRRGYLKFNVEGVPAGQVVTSAILKLNISQVSVTAAALNFGVYGFYDNTWTEELTWNTQAAAAITIPAVPAVDEVPEVPAVPGVLGEKLYEMNFPISVSKNEAEPIPVDIDVTDFVNSKSGASDYMISFAIYDYNTPPTNGHIRIISKENAVNAAAAAKLVVTTEVPTAISDVASKSNISVSTYQNQIVVKGNNDLSSVNVYSLSGVKVYSAKNLGNTANVNVSQKGVYVVQVVSGSDKVSKKVVLK